VAIRESDMAKSLVALGTAAILSAATLTTSKPAAAQPWLLPVAAGFLTGAFVGAAAASPNPYYSPYYGGYGGYYGGYGGYYGGYGGYYNTAYYGAQPYYGGYGSNTTVVIITGNNGYNGYGYNGYPCHYHCGPYYQHY
jgi:hypothetical protein